MVQSPFAEVERIADARRERNVEQVACARIRPAVIAANEPGRVAACFVADRHTAVRATVEEGSGRAFAVATQNDGPGAEICELEIMRLGNLALVAEVDPGAAEDALHLVGEHRGIGVQGAMDPVVTDERSVIRLGARRLNGSRCHSSPLACYRQLRGGGLDTESTPA